MQPFSRRQGLEPNQSLQLDSMDRGLRTGLWNCVIRHCFVSNHYLDWNENLSQVAEAVWSECLQLPIDDMPDYWGDMRERIREIFFDAEWYVVYNVIEFLANFYASAPDGELQEVGERFVAACNNALARNASGYRFVGTNLTPLVGEQEIHAAEQVLTLGTGLSTVVHHMDRAIQLLADRQSPDYRNSIKESISAVESICAIITANPQATLGMALKHIGKQRQVELHGALRGAFEQLYGYTSDAEGIRHKLTEEPNLDVEDAVFMLVACSAFVNYLVAKAAKAGIEF